MDDKKIFLERLLEYGSREAVIQNLQDAGCTSSLIECCLAYMEQGKKKELLQRLEEHRADLLHKVHTEERHIDCLDYLVYQIQRCEMKLSCTLLREKR